MMNKLLKRVNEIKLEDIALGVIVSVMAAAGTYAIYHIAADKDFPIRYDFSISQLERSDSLYRENT